VLVYGNGNARIEYREPAASYVAQIDPAQILAQIVLPQTDVSNVRESKGVGKK